MNAPRTFAVCLLVLLALADTALVAQSSSRSARREQRRERQEWKRTARQYVRNPLALRDQTQQQQAQTQQLTQRATQAETTAQQQAAALAAREDSIRALKAERERIQEELRRQQELAAQAAQQAQQAAQNGGGNAGNGQGQGMPAGIVFRVQVGAYERFDLSRYNLADENWHTAQNNQLKCYQIGYFNKLQNANAFCADIRRMGIRDAFVVAYKDGQRMPVQEAARLAGQR